RNKIWMFRDRAPLAPLERLVYGGSTLRRWGRTFAASHDPRTLSSSLARGVAPGVRTPPPPTREGRAGARPPGPARGPDRRGITPAARARRAPRRPRPLARRQAGGPPRAGSARRRCPGPRLGRG